MPSIVPSSFIVLRTHMCEMDLTGECLPTNYSRCRGRCTEPAIRRKTASQSCGQAAACVGPRTADRGYVNSTIHKAHSVVMRRAVGLQSCGIWIVSIANSSAPGEPYILARCVVAAARICSVRNRESVL